MKRTPKTPTEEASLLAFGAHPDDIEFGCGAVIAAETRAGRAVRLVVCSRGEAGTNGTPAARTAEARLAAKLLGATIEFANLGGDAHFDCTATRAIQLAAIIRRVRPAIVLAPSLVENQHPDHYRLARMVRDATRLARYGGVKELGRQAPHRIEALLFFAVAPEAEPRDITPVVVDVSAPDVIAAWTRAMEAHASQMRTRNYAELQLTRARLLGQRCGCDHAIALYPNEPLVLDSLAPFTAARVRR